jgi:hypothetical protein
MPVDKKCMKCKELVKLPRECRNCGKKKFYNRIPYEWGLTTDDLIGLFCEQCGKGRKYFECKKCGCENPAEHFKWFFEQISV